jgi:hypothetical protein
MEEFIRDMIKKGSDIAHTGKVQDVCNAAFYAGAIYALKMTIPRATFLMSYSENMDSLRALQICGWITPTFFGDIKLPEDFNATPADHALDLIFFPDDFPTREVKKLRTELARVLSKTPPPPTKEP